MAVMTLTVPDAEVQRVIDAYVETFGPIPNGMTGGEYVRQQLIVWMKATVRASEVRAQSKAAALTAGTAAAPTVT